MTSDGQAVERLRDYLRTLTPAARAMLVVELERALLRGEESAGNDLVLQELRRAIRAGTKRVSRIGDAARLFFVPTEPFLVDAPGDHRRAGRLARTSLEPIWEWISRDLMPAETKALSEDINRALLAGDRSKADQLMRELHDRAVQRMKEVVAAAGTDEKAQRKLAVQVGTSRVLEDILALLVILESRDVLGEVSRRLPLHIRVLDRDQVDAVKVQLDAAAGKSPEQSSARKAEILLYGLVMVINRLAVPWQLIRVATRAADSDDTTRIAATPYAPAVTIALSELESTVSELRTELKAGRPVTSMIKELHGGARGLRTELDLSIESPWSRHLAAIRSEVSTMLKPEIESTPGRVRRLLRPRPAKEIAPGSVLDSVDVDETEAGVELLVACRNYAGELALSEVTTRSSSDLTQYLEASTKALLDSLRRAEETDRPFRQSQIDAAIRFCRPLFGAEYAGLLAKAADVAAQSAAGERKVAWA